MDQTPLPTAATAFCTIPFTLFANAPMGRALVRGVNQECLTASSVQPCPALNGSVLVPGFAIAPSNPAPEFKYILVLLSAAAGAPVVEVFEQFNFSVPAPGPRPLAALNIANPIKAVSLLHQRAQGDFAEYLRLNPNTARARLERYISVQYPGSTNIAPALAAFRSEPFVLAAYEPQNFEFSASAPAQSSATPSQKGGTPTGQNQYHLPAINIEQAWARAGGWSFVGLADSGLMTNHPDLRSFSGTGSVGGNFVPGGNFLPALSKDISAGRLATTPDVDERKLVPAPAVACDLLDGNPDGLMQLNFAGHGTHASGLVAANVQNNDRIEGVCKNCSIGMWKLNSIVCRIDNQGASVFSFFSPVGAPDAINALSDIGAQVINLSFGDSITPNGFCAANPMAPMCVALEVARENDVAVVAASGNNRDSIQFPGHDLRTIAVGGTDPTGAFWDRGDQCPFAMSDRECGSNFTFFNNDRRQELTVAAAEVRSTVYTGINWNADLGCGDSIGDDLPSDGIGLCTGTSMSAPIVSGIIGILRSINPLVPVGTADVFGARTIRSTLIGNTNRAQQALPWNNRFGYGTPDVAASAAAILGRVGGSVVRNRAIPLFGFYGSTAKDYAAVATPQLAMALSRNIAGAYLSIGANLIDGAIIPQYGTFPSQFGTIVQPPRARAYILSTEFSPNSTPLTALYLMNRSRRFPLNCNPNQPTCNVNNRDFILVTAADVMAQSAAGYELMGQQGYIYVQQAAGSSALYLQCKPADDDCAVFIAEQKAEFESAGYTQLLPGRTSNILGYAYNTVNSDTDELPDAFERVVGTNWLNANSDGDALSDSEEFPMVGMAFSDPCAGPVLQCNLAADNVFANGFEGL